MFQSIGLKEFRPFLSLDPSARASPAGNALFADGCARLKLVTRQYARRQQRWVVNRMLKSTTDRQV
jgi:tRNA dimethylallyltransferase